MSSQTLGLGTHLTHKANRNQTRHGWVRLTPAYSVHLVSAVLDTLDDENPIVLDPFCGTGTTALCCAERAIPCDTTDINPFLVWLTTAKTRAYRYDEILAFKEHALAIDHAFRDTHGAEGWVPALHQIEKWWDTQTLRRLSRAMGHIKALEFESSAAVVDLLKIAFCRVMIASSHASFGHQSMSFTKDAGTRSAHRPLHDVSSRWQETVCELAHAATSEIHVQPNAYLCDARNVHTHCAKEQYTCVVTSPPYPNRMSYIRELRPYMYWLGYLETGREAGELDWKAIGGTWGCATSNVGKWQPDRPVTIPYTGFDDILTHIGAVSPLLSKYVHKYFVDMMEHAHQLFEVVKPQGQIHYIVGNSKYYDVMLPVESMFAALFESVGFQNVTIEPIRKRTSKKELYEFVVSAQK